MAGYIGQKPAVNGIYTVDEFTSSGGTTYTLSRVPGSKNNMQVSAGGLVQYPSAYSFSGTTLTLSGVPSGQKVIVRHMGETILYPVLDDNAVTTAKIADDSITAAKIADGSITAAKLAAGVGDADTTRLEYNQAILAFKIASSNQLAKFSMVDQVIDEYQDATGIDAGNSTNELAGGATTAKYYGGGSSTSVTATGGTITTDGDYTIHSFTADGSFVTNTAQAVEYLVVGGGGGAASGGGGAGGYRSGTAFSLSAATHAVVVGTGGAFGAASSSPGTNGLASSLTPSGLSAISGSGGGGGAGGGNNNGLTGGSGGGGGGYSGLGTVGNSGGYSPVEGYGGGNGWSDNTHSTLGGGGGGAGAVGVAGSGTAGNSSVARPGNGGAGLANDITGTSLFYAGGGAGGGDTCGFKGQGGSSVGGNGGAQAGAAQGAATAPTANTGSGGGGVTNTNSYTRTAGADGVVIIRRPTIVLTSGGNLTLQSTATTAESAPTKADLVVLIEDASGTATINTDIKAKVSRDGSAFSGYVTFVDEGDRGTNKRILVAREVDISGITSGTSMKYKIETLNQSAGSKETRIHATSLAWA